MQIEKESKMKSKKPEIIIRYSTEELPNERELFVKGWLLLLSGQPDIKKKSVACLVKN